MQLRRNGSVPLYRQVRDAISERIQRGEFAAGERLPSEAQLAADLRINRLTVRRAMEELTREGVVFTRRGAGTFVADAPARTPLALSLSPAPDWAALAKELARELTSGEDYREVLLSYDEDDDPRIRRDLGVARGRLSRLETAFEVAGEPLMLATLWTSRRLGLKMREAWPELPGDYAVLREEYGSELYALWRSFSAEAATVEDASLFDVHPGAPLLVREGVTVDRFGTPILRSRRRVRGDRISYIMRFELDLAGTDGAADS